MIKFFFVWLVSVVYAAMPACAQEYSYTHYDGTHFSNFTTSGGLPDLEVLQPGNTLNISQKGCL
jgi:hypothetical protein